MMNTKETTLQSLLFLGVVFTILDPMHGKWIEAKDPASARYGDNLEILVAIIPEQTEPRRRRRDARSDRGNVGNCYSDEYWSEYYQKCKGCIRCSPGTEHNPPEYCGYGRGQETRCTPCQDGFFQSQEGINIPRCQQCSVCDPHASIESACTRRSDTVCGKCQEGWFYNVTEVCVECTESDIIDPSNTDCYDEPDSIPGPQPAPGPGPQPVPGPQPSPVPQSPLVTSHDQSDSKSPHIPGKSASAPPNNTLSLLEIMLIIGAIVAATIAIVLVTFFVIRRRKKKNANVRKDVVAAAENGLELKPMIKGVNKNIHAEDKRPGYSGASGGSTDELVAPASQQDTSGKMSTSYKDNPHVPDVCPEVLNDIPDTDEYPTRNFVVCDTKFDPVITAQDLSMQDLRSMPQSLKSRPHEVNNATDRAHAKSPTEARAYSEKRKDDDVGGHVKCRSGCDISEPRHNAGAGPYDVLPSLDSPPHTLSSRLEDNIVR